VDFEGRQERTASVNLRCNAFGGHSRTDDFSIEGQRHIDAFQIGQKAGDDGQCTFGSGQQVHVAGDAISTSCHENSPALQRFTHVIPVSPMLRDIGPEIS
jgi:hypothetical protein